MCTNTAVTPDKIVVQLRDKNGNIIGGGQGTGGTITVTTPPETTNACASVSTHNDASSGCVQL